jgi:dienelactone hydrolase
LAFVVDALQAAGAATGNALFGKIAPQSAVMGHSMGGGATFLSVQHSSNITGIVPLAPAETNPSAIAAAGGITVPALVIAGEEDCVTPPGSNQLPMYTALQSDCKFYVQFDGASHCQFAENAALCRTGEVFVCIGRTFISLSAQEARTLAVLVPWLEVVLQTDNGNWQNFRDAVEAAQGAGIAVVQQSCGDA